MCRSDNFRRAALLRHPDCGFTGVFEAVLRRIGNGTPTPDEARAASSFLHGPFKARPAASPHSSFEGLPSFFFRLFGWLSAATLVRCPTRLRPRRKHGATMLSVLSGMAREYRAHAALARAYADATRDPRTRKAYLDIERY